MAQQTILRVQTNIVNPDVFVPEATLTIITGSTSGFSYVGDGSILTPYTGTTTSNTTTINLNVNNTGGVVNFSISGNSTLNVTAYIDNEFVNYSIVADSNTIKSGFFDVQNDQVVKFIISSSATGSTISYIYIQPNVDESTVYEFRDLDLYDDIPIKINKSFAEIQDISKRNSDFSIGLKLPGSKKNNKFFEDFFNVDARSLFFNVTKRTPCKVLLDDEVYFDGFLRLNKTSVQNSQVEYDVTLYSIIGDLFGKIGNNLLKDLNYYDSEYSFNHTFDKYAVQAWDYSIFTFDDPPNYFYPIVHNGYEYTGDTVFISGGTIDQNTRLYTSTIVGTYANNAAAYSAGVKRYRINSPEDGLLDNQLKPALNVESIIRLMFKTYGYTIKSDFFNTPWFRLLYVYGYFSSDQTKFGYRVPPAQQLPVTEVELYLKNNGDLTFSVIVTKAGTGTPVSAEGDMTVTVRFAEPIFTFPITYIYYNFQYTIPKGQTIITQNYPNTGYTLVDIVSNLSSAPQTYLLDYTPQAVNSIVSYNEGDFVDFGLVIDDKLKQIDFLSSIAKKFNLVFVNDPDISNQIIIEPFQYYIGTGQIYDWTDKLSYDKGFSVEPALNFVESDLFLSDLEDGDFGNQQYKNRNNRIYGENYVYNPTDFKSQTKKIETIFSPEIIRIWDTVDTQPNGEIKLPLGINYALVTDGSTSGPSESVVPKYKGVKTKPKLFYFLGTYNPFLDTFGEVLSYTGTTYTNLIYVAESNGSNVRGTNWAPLISHTMPIGNPDENKINNDSICNLFKSEEAIDIGVSTFNAFTEQDAYSLFYQNRINNLYDFNTRYLKGNFDLKLTDIKNLQPKDIIKINERYFTWNKLDGYNLTNPEMTSVELIQFNNVISEYPTRYFMYYYCDSPSTIFKFQTDMTNPSLSGTSYGWSIFYDYNIGVLTGSTKTGFTSTVSVTQSGERVYIPYYMYEVDETTYNASGTGRTFDSIWTSTLDYPTLSGGDLNKINYPAYIFTTGATTELIFNLFEDCDQFDSVATAQGIPVGNSGNAPEDLFYSGITLNVTSIGWIKYQTETDAIYQYISSTGTYTITDCADCDSVVPGTPYGTIAAFTITNCGTLCS
jgi:hypothetical protein